MKKSLITKLSCAFIFLAISSANAQDSKNQQYIIEKNHTSVMWIADHFGFSKVSGKFTDIDGSITFNDKTVELSKVEVVINTNEIATGLPKFEKHLKSKDFFDVDNFPTAKFVSKKIVKKSKDKAEIYGDLTLLGVTKEVVLDTKLNKSSPNPMSQKPTIGFSAKTTINRSDFNMKYALPGIADKVDLIIEVEANQ
ncbi:MAG: YceI family protein [Alphaproteobacteria bacterium]